MPIDSVPRRMSYAGISKIFSQATGEMQLRKIIYAHIMHSFILSLAEI